MTAAVETLVLPFMKGELPIPARALFLGAEPHTALHAWPQVIGWQPLKPPRPEKMDGDAFLEYLLRYSGET